MGGADKLSAMLLATAMMLALVPGLPVAQAASDGCGDPGCHLERSIDGDHWVGELSMASETTIEAGSTIEAELGFDEATDRTGFLFVLEDIEDGSIPLGLVVWIDAFRDEVRVHHETIAGEPADVSISPVGELTWDGIKATVQWNLDQTLDAHDHRLIVVGPTADALDLVLSLDSQQTIDLTTETSGSSQGSLVADDGWDPATSVDAPSFRMLQGGQHELDVPSDHRLYAFHGPATVGAGAFDACFLAGGYCGAVAGATGTNWGYSAYGLEDPDGDSEDREASWPVCTFATCPDGPGESGAFVLLGEDPGSWTFTVDEHVGVGTAPDMILLAAPIALP